MNASKPNSENWTYQELALATIRARSKGKKMLARLDQQLLNVHNMMIIDQSPQCVSCCGDNPPDVYQLYL